MLIQFLLSMVSRAWECQYHANVDYDAKRFVEAATGKDFLKARKIAIANHGKGSDLSRSFLFHQ